MLALFGALLAHKYVSAGPVTMTVVALLGATLLDGVTSLRAHARASDLVAIGELRAAHAVPALRAALAAEGIPATATGVATLALLQGFGPYAPARIFVRADDAERAAALLRHWAAGEAKPMQAGEAVPMGESGPAFGTGRTAGLCALGALGAAVWVLPGGRATSLAKVPRTEISIVAVDDQADPLRLRAGRAERGMDEELAEEEAEESLPDDVALYTESVPLGATHARRRYARVSVEPPESNAQAWARVRPWLDTIPLPAGDRWAWEEVSEPVYEKDKDDRPTSWRVVGLRTFVLSGEPIVTTSDVRYASSGLDEDETEAHVTVTFTPEAGERFHAFTSRWVGRRLAILVDGRVASAPFVKQPIEGGRVVITVGRGYADGGLAAARELAASLRGETD
jgi:hypothetical protein